MTHAIYPVTPILEGVSDLRRPGLLLLGAGYPPPGTTVPDPFRQQVLRLHAQLIAEDPLHQLEREGGLCVYALHLDDLASQGSSQALAQLDGNGELVVDMDALAGALGDVLVDRRTPAVELLFHPFESTRPPSRLVPVLLHGPNGNDTGELEWLDNTHAIPYLLGTSQERRVLQVALKALGHLYGLGPETTNSALKPSSYYYNIQGTLQTDALSTRGFRELQAAFIGAEAYEEESLPGTFYELFGSRCVMRIEVGNHTEAGATSSLDSGYCLACRKAMAWALLESPWCRTNRRRTLANQTLRFDEDFAEPTLDDSTPTFDVGASTAQYYGSEPHWGAKAVIDDELGLVLLDVQLHFDDSPTQWVADRIEFRNLRVDLDGVTHDFPIESATRTVHVAEDGSDLHQWGVKVTLTAPVGPPGGNTALVRAELSCVFRGGAGDFDPPGAIMAATFFPQLGLTWLDDPDHSARVTGLHGEVVILARPVMAEPMASMLGVSSEPITTASFFADGNFVGGKDGFRRHLEDRVGEVISPVKWAVLWGLASLSPIPVAGTAVVAAFIDDLYDNRHALASFWPALFDYVDLQATVPGAKLPSKGDTPTLIERAIIGVDNDAGERTATAKGPFSEEKALRKLPRQGQYDNVHVHGNMGWYEAESFSRRRLMAPFCGHACLHLHWRWGEGASAIADLYRTPSGGFLRQWAAAVLQHEATGGSAQDIDLDEIYALHPAALQAAETLMEMAASGLEASCSVDRGWGGSVRQAEAYVVPGAPLIPPTQELTVRIAPAHRLDDLSTVDTDPTMSFDRVKALWYAVHIPTGVERGRREVILEQGAGVAYAYQSGPVEVGARLLLAAVHLDPSFVPWTLAKVNGDYELVPRTDAKSIDAVFRELYTLMRFAGDEDDAHPTRESALFGDVTRDVDDDVLLEDL